MFQMHFVELAVDINRITFCTHIYINDLLSNWKHNVEAGIMLKRNLYLNTLLFAIDK
jgi:hypothetical protein